MTFTPVVAVIVLLSVDWVEAGKNLRDKAEENKHFRKGMNRLVGDHSVTPQGAELWGNWFLATVIQNTIEKNAVPDPWCSLWNIFVGMRENFIELQERDESTDSSGQGNARPLIATESFWNDVMKPVEETCKKSKKKKKTYDLKELAKKNLQTQQELVAGFFDEMLRPCEDHYQWWYGHLNKKRVARDAALTTASPFVGVSEGMSGTGGSSADGVAGAIAPQPGIAGLDNFGGLGGGGGLDGLGNMLDAGGDGEAQMVSLASSSIITTGVAAGVLLRSGAQSTSAGSVAGYSAGKDMSKGIETLATQTGWKWDFETDDEKGKKWLNELNNRLEDDAEDSSGSSGSEDSSGSSESSSGDTEDDDDDDDEEDSSSGSSSE